MTHWIVLGIMVVACAGPAQAADDLAKQIQTVARQGGGSAAGRAAWDKIVAAGPAVLPRLLLALDTQETVAANWLRTAFDNIADREFVKNKGRGLDGDKLLAFAKDPRHRGRARRLALEVVERLRPGTSRKLFTGWLADPEFRYEAVDFTLEAAAAFVKKGHKGLATAAYRMAFAAVRDLQQAKKVAAGLQKLGVTVSVARHLGFFTDWYLIGPFDARGLKGFKSVYPPERKIDLAAELDGQGKRVRWKRYRVKEPAPLAPGPHVALVNLREPLGDADDAVAYAYTEFSVPKAVQVEFRGAADDNFTVWVNGKRAFGFEEYRNGVRFDRHRFRVALRAGKNTVLVKVCQYLTNSEPNWEFLLRVVDETGKGFPFTETLK